MSFAVVLLQVASLTGEAASDLKKLDSCQLILASPTHWDMLSRRWKQRKAVQGVSLFIMDEMHLIGGAKGPSMEVVCSRMRYMSTQAGVSLRIVGLSHSLANARDIAEWIGASPHGTFNFSPAVRPVPLEIHLHGLDITNFEARMQVRQEKCESLMYFCC